MLFRSMTVKIQTPEELEQASESMQEDLADLKDVRYQHESDQSDTPAASGQKPLPAGPKVGRNDPCPCGSGKKYKQCHGQLA